jgi:hypothetical protein
MTAPPSFSLFLHCNGDFAALKMKLNETSIAELSRREGIAESMYYS